jgi:hypothetical protein
VLFHAQRQRSLAGAECGKDEEQSSPLSIAWKFPRTPTDSVIHAAADPPPTCSGKLFGEVGLNLANGPIGLDGRLRTPMTASPASVLSA